MLLIVTYFHNDCEILKKGFITSATPPPLFCPFLVKMILYFEFVIVADTHSLPVNFYLNILFILIFKTLRLLLSVLILDCSIRV